MPFVSVVIVVWLVAPTLIGVLLFFFTHFEYISFQIGCICMFL
jgi:hypothetical protein